MKFKKIAVFILVLLAVFSFTAVDEAYSNMMDHPGKLSLNIRRVNSDYITISIFGQSAAVNTKKLQDDWSEFSNKVTTGLDNTVGEIKGLIGLEKYEPDYSTFKSEML